MRKWWFALVMLMAIAPAASAETMRVSWYGPGYEGRPTASGEIFQSAKLTAAHASWPLGTIVTVQNPHNGRSVQVKVNDRSAAPGLDLSVGAAQALSSTDYDLMYEGIGYLEVNVVQWGDR